MVIVMVSPSLSWASVGKEGIKTKIITRAMLTIRGLIFPANLPKLTHNNLLPANQSMTLVLKRAKKLEMRKNYHA